MAETAQAQPGGLMKIGTVAALNITQTLALPIEKAPVIEQAIKDEINAMSSHFTLAYADIQNTYEIELAKIKSTWTYVRDEPVLVATVLGVTFLVGLLLGHFAL